MNATLSEVSAAPVAPVRAAPGDEPELGRETAALKDALVAFIRDGADPEAQVEASRLIATLIALGDDPRSGDVALMKTGVSALMAKHANIGIAKFVRNRLEINHRNARRGFIPWLSRRLGDSAVYAMLVGVIFSALLWGLAYTLVVGIGYWLTREFGFQFVLPVHQASPLAFAAFVGGLVSLLSRVDQFAGLYIFDPILIFVNCLLKPLIGTALALTVYTIIASGIIEIKGLSFDVSPDGYRFIHWAFGFIAGFSERLAGDFIARAEGVVGRTSGDTGQPQSGGAKSQPR